MTDKKELAGNIAVFTYYGMWWLGRAGEKGTAYTLVTEKDKEFAGHLVRNLEGANQPVPKPLLDLANQVISCHPISIPTYLMK